MSARILKFPGPPHPERREVAQFAMYCMGSCHGDWHPKVDEVYEQVMTDDAVYAFYLESFKDHERWRGDGGSCRARSVIYRARQYWHRLSPEGKRQAVFDLPGLSVEAIRKLVPERKEVDE